MTFTVLMMTFVISFIVIENVLPRLYRREFVREYDELIDKLQNELIDELQVEITFQVERFSGMNTSADLAREELDEIVYFYRQTCLGENVSQDGVLLATEHADPCEFALMEIDFLSRLIEENIEDDPWTRNQSVEWFHLRQMRDHHEQEGSILYMTVEHILNDFAINNNVRIIVWDIPAFTHDELGEVLFYIEGRSAEMEFMTMLDETEIGVREQRFHNFESGGFAIAISGTFQPAYRVLTIIGALGQQLLVAAFFVSMIISLLFSRYVAYPIVTLSTRSKRLRELDFDAHLKISRQDEIGELSNNLNYMSLKLGHALDELQTANEKLTIEMAREREQEQERRNLFTSISHELKTPITILKGEVGGMIDGIGVYKDRDVYLKSTYGWIESLEKLVSEILTISRLEGEKMRLNLMEIDISSLITEVCLTLVPLADRQKISFKQEIEPNLKVYADVTQLQIAISNVISNAIFHTLPDQLVEICLSQIDGAVTLTVLNTGAQIEEDDLKQLFKPFYRIDQSRNRHTGGSGLGLFIVKNILELHQFEYALENVTTGVCFLVKIPLKND